MIVCPICKEDLQKKERTYVCLNGHSFDQAKQGYTNLLVGHSKKIHGDCKDMLAARLDIQKQGYYAFIARAVYEVIKNLPIRNIVDIGCGVGYYTNYIAEKLSIDVVGIDVSKEALKIASRVGKDVSYFVASNKSLPIKEESVDFVLSIFSPIFLEEVRRVLRYDKYILVVSPNLNHMMELKDIVYDEILRKEEERNYIMDEDFVLVEEHNISKSHHFAQKELGNLFLMTPHYFTSSVNGKKRLANTKELSITLDVNIRLYQRRNEVEHD